MDGRADAQVNCVPIIVWLAYFILAIVSCLGQERCSRDIDLCLRSCGGFSRKMQNNGILSLRSLAKSGKVSGQKQAGSWKKMEDSWTQRTSANS